MGSPEQTGPSESEPKVLFTVMFKFDNPRVLEAQRQGAEALNYIFKQQPGLDEWERVYMGSVDAEGQPLAVFICDSPPCALNTPEQAIRRMAAGRMFDWLAALGVESSRLAYAGIRKGLIGSQYITQFTEFTEEIHDAYKDMVFLRNASNQGTKRYDTPR